MIRVLHFADLINRDDFIHNVISHADPREFAMLAATLHDGGTLNVDPSPLPVVHDLRCRTRRRYPLAISRLRSLIDHAEVDVLHAHHYEPALIGAIATAGTAVPLVIGRHYSDAIYQLSRGARRRVLLGLEALSNWRARAIVAPSRAVHDVLLRQGVPAGRVEVIPYGFDFRRFEARDSGTLARMRSEWPSGPGLRLVTVGRLHGEKGHRYLIDAIALLAGERFETRWLVVGRGPEEESLVAEVARRGLSDRVRFAGWRADVLDIVAAADVVVQPTLHEAFSQAMVEAMALGRPLVISDVSGVTDLVEHERSGLVVHPRDSAGLAAAVRRLADPRVAEAMGESARLRVRATLDIGVVGPKLEALYRRVARG